MSNFDDLFDPAPQNEDFDKEAWAAKKKAERDEVYALLRTPPPKKSAQTAANSVTISMYRRISVIIPQPTPF